MAQIIPFSVEDDISVSDWNKVKVLGEGSYGVVFFGRPTKPNLGHVAIKVAPCSQASSLIKEKAILKQFIGCPEIVQYIGNGITMEEDDFIYNLILEYAAGGTLSDMIKQEEKLSEEDAKRYLRMILRGLSCIHAKGFVHADLKPANILAFPLKCGGMKLKIADFGLSKIYNYKKKERDLQRNNRKMKFAGTAKYMSPESVLGNIKPALDIWSLGCIFVKMVTGKSVWNDCENHEEMILKLIFAKEIPTIPEELSERGKHFLQKCFERNYSERWSADMLLKHPYLVEGKKVSNKMSCRNFSILLCIVTLCIILVARFLIF